MTNIRGVKELDKKLDKLIKLKVKFDSRPFLKEQRRIFDTKGRAIKMPWKKRNKLRITRTATYYPYHQLGTKYLPIRATIGINKRVEKEAIRQVIKAIRKELK